MNNQLLNGRYRLIRPLGAGGMASVCLAEDPRLGRQVAVKILHPQFASDPTFVARFEGEARMAAGLAHPNIVGVYDVGHDGDRYYIVMEYVEGETLKELIERQGALPAPRALALIGGVLSALTFAHNHNLVHRDIKAQNILLTPSGDVKVTDFGIARELAGTMAATLTATGMVIGTVQYFSPEQAQGRPATTQSDVYSAGIVLYETLTGKLPFEADNPLAVAMQQINQPPPLPSRLNPAIPASVEAIVLRALAKNPAQRYAGAEAMKRDVDAAFAGAAQPTRVATRLQPTITAGARQGTARTTVRTATAAAQPTAPAQAPSRALPIAIVALALIIIGLIGAYLHAGGFGGAGAGTPNPTATPTAVATTPAPTTTSPAPVIVPPTRTPALRPTATATTPPSTATSTDTPGPTNTPTAAPATATAGPTATDTPTNTPVPTTNTPTDTPTNIPAPTATDTPTDTVGPTATDTPGAATATATPQGQGGTAANAGTITLSPTSANPGDTVTVSGAGWPDGATITLSGDFDQGNDLGSTTSTGGSFSASFTVPAGTGAGTYHITATGDQGGTATQNLAVNDNSAGP